MSVTHPLPCLLRIGVVCSSFWAALFCWTVAVGAGAAINGPPWQDKNTAVRRQGRGLLDGQLCGSTSRTGTAGVLRQQACSGVRTGHTLCDCVSYQHMVRLRSMPAAAPTDASLGLPSFMSRNEPKAATPQHCGRTGTAQQPCVQQRTVRCRKGTGWRRGGILVGVSPTSSSSLGQLCKRHHGMCACRAVVEIWAVVWSF